MGCKQFSNLSFRGNQRLQRLQARQCPSHTWDVLVPNNWRIRAQQEGTSNVPYDNSCLCFPKSFMLSPGIWWNPYLVILICLFGSARAVKITIPAGMHPYWQCMFGLLYGHGPRSGKPVSEFVTGGSRGMSPTPSRRVGGSCRNHVLTIFHRAYVNNREACGRPPDHPESEEIRERRNLRCNLPPSLDLSSVALTERATTTLNPRGDITLAVSV